MASFEKFVERHGEVAAQALIENIERFHGIRTQTLKCLEDRWDFLMNPHAEQQHITAVAA